MGDDMIKIARLTIDLCAGLFYASDNFQENKPNDQLTGPKNGDAGIRAPAVGPRCLNIFRDCVGNGGAGSNMPGSTFVQSQCDWTNGVGADAKPLEGILEVIPSGISAMSETPLDVTFHVDEYICQYIADTNENQAAVINRQPVGILKINGRAMEWRDVQRLQKYCKITVRVPLDGRLKVGPARVEIEAQSGTKAVITKQGLNPNDGDPSKIYWGAIARNIGMLYVYADPSQDASIVEPAVVNVNQCDLDVLVRFPQYTMAMKYNTDKDSIWCYWRQPYSKTPPNIAWDESIFQSWVQVDSQGIVGVKCKLPQMTDQVLELKLAFNANIDGVGNYHTIKAKINRLGDPSGDIPADGVMRMYSVSPKSGPEAGGTLVTIRGQYFSKYCNPDYCNNINCQFIYSKAGGFKTLVVDATFIDDKTLKCITPRVQPEVWDVKIQISVDANRACATKPDSTLLANQMDFVYQTSNTRAQIPPEAPRDRDVTSTPFRLQGKWTRCNNITNGSTCGAWPGQGAGDLGHYSCLPGFYDWGGKTTSIEYPVWCIRALPLNGASSYFFSLTDPFFNIIASAVRPVPEKYPGYCHRTNHHFGWDKLSHKLDYRYFDLFDKNYSRGARALSGKVTQGRNLIDRLWSTTALNLTIPYMRNKMHTIGEKYGFIDLGTSFSIALDFTLAQTFDEKAYRRNLRCAKPVPTFQAYSGDIGDDDAKGSYINWTAHIWSDGKPSCKIDPKFPSLAERCMQQIVKSPNKQDDTGVMLTEPAELRIKQSIKDQVVGCARIRVSFSCSNFSLSQCVEELITRDVNESRFRNKGTRQDYHSFESWCNFTYPENAGPSNTQTDSEDRVLGWNAEKPEEEDWRYSFRNSPCVRCQQSKELCAALESKDETKDSVPGAPNFLSLGDKDAAVEISLGCFGPSEPAADSDGQDEAVEDECCDDVNDNRGAEADEAALPWLWRGTCPRTSERCVRPRRKYLCAKDDDRSVLLLMFLHSPLTSEAMPARPYLDQSQACAFVFMRLAACLPACLPCCPASCKL